MSTPAGNLAVNTAEAARLKAWEEVQKAQYTLPEQEKITVKQASLAAVVGLPLGVASYSGYNLYVAGMSINAIASLALVNAAQVATQVAGALVAGGALTMLGTQVVAIGAVASIVAIARHNLPGDFSFMQMNIGGKGMSLLEFFGKGYSKNLDELRTKIFAKILPKRALVGEMSDKTVLDKMKADTTFIPNADEPIGKQILRYRKVLIEKGNAADIARTDCNLETFAGKKGDAFDLTTVLTACMTKLENNADTQNKGILTSEDIAAEAKFRAKWGASNIFALLMSASSKNDKKPMGSQFFLKVENSFVKDNMDSKLPTLNGDEDLVSDVTQQITNLFEALFTVEPARGDFKRVYDHILDSKQAANFNPETVRDLMKKHLDFNTMKDAKGIALTPAELEWACTPGGQVIMFGYWQALQLQLASKVVTAAEINDGKKELQKLLGSMKDRAVAFVKDLMRLDVGVVATQECPKEHIAEMTREPTAWEKFCGRKRYFHVHKDEDGKEVAGAVGTGVFLREDLWEPDAQIIPHVCAGAKSKLVCVLATQKKTGQKFLHVSIHGDSSHPEDGRDKLKEAFNVFKALSTMPGNEDLELVIGTDANTKKAVDIEALRELAFSMGLQITDVGSTSIKVRAQSVQIAKIGDRVDTEEDFGLTKLSKRYTIKDLLLAGSRTRLGSRVVALPCLLKEFHFSDHASILMRIGKVWTVIEGIRYYFGGAKKQPTNLRNGLAGFDDAYETQLEAVKAASKKKAADAKADADAAAADADAAAAKPAEEKKN